MAVQWAVENTRSSVYMFDPGDIKIKPELNGRHEAPEVEGLIASILEHGQLQPVLVRSENDKPVLLAGFSRWTAVSEINKRKLAPVRMKLACVYVRCNEQDGYVRNWQENRERNQTTPMDDAHHFAQLLKWGWTEEDVANRLKVKPRYVKDRLALIEAEPEVQHAVTEGRIKPTAAVKLAKLAAEQQRTVAKMNGKVSAKQVDAATGKRSRPSFRAVYEFVETMTGPGEDKVVRQTAKKILEFMEGK